MNLPFYVLSINALLLLTVTSYIDNRFYCWNPHLYTRALCFLLRVHVVRHRYQLYSSGKILMTDHHFQVSQLICYLTCKPLSTGNLLPVYVVIARGCPKTTSLTSHPIPFQFFAWDKCIGNGLRFYFTHLQLQWAQLHNCTAPQ